MTAKIEFTQARVGTPSYDEEDPHDRLKNLSKAVVSLAENLKNNHDQTLCAFLKLRHERFKLMQSLSSIESLST